MKIIMQDLIKRIEAAGPDRELDAEIWLAETPGATRKQWSYIHKATGRECHVDETRENGTLIIVPAYTSSIDAAMTLVPEGWVIAQLGQGDDRTWWAELRQGYRTSYDNVSIGGQLKNATPALALCAAALRARMAKNKG